MNDCCMSMLFSASSSTISVGRDAGTVRPLGSLLLVLTSVCAALQLHVVLTGCTGVIEREFYDGPSMRAKDGRVVVQVAQGSKSVLM